MDPFESLVAEFAGKAGLTLQSGKDGSVDLVVDGVTRSASTRPSEQSAAYPGFVSAPTLGEGRNLSPRCV